MIRWWKSQLLQSFLIIVIKIIMLHLLTSQFLIKSPTRSYRQGLDELGELDASILQRDKEGGVVSLLYSLFSSVLLRRPWCIGWKWGQTWCFELLAIFALHLVLSWGRNMSPVVISETDALSLYCTSEYQTNIPKLWWGQSISPIFTIPPNEWGWVEISHSDVRAMSFFTFSGTQSCCNMSEKFQFPFSHWLPMDSVGGNSCPYG